MVQELHEMFELVFFYHDGENMYVCFWAIGEVMGVIEMVVDKQDDRDVHNVGKVVTKEWRYVVLIVDPWNWINILSLKLLKILSYLCCWSL